MVTRNVETSSELHARRGDSGWGRTLRRCKTVIGPSACSRRACGTRSQQRVRYLCSSWRPDEDELQAVVADEGVVVAAIDGDVRRGKRVLKEQRGQTMKQHFVTFAKYNAWANARIYKAASGVSDEQYRRDLGLYFKSLHGTLNHLLTADRIWMRRLTGTGDHPSSLNAIVCEDLRSLSSARLAEDARILAFVEALAEEDLERVLEYRTMAGTVIRQKWREVLAHVFNHQTHHRGQAHAALTILGVAEPDGLDLLILQRELGGV